MGRDPRDGRLAQPPLDLTFATATEADAAAIAAVRSAAAEQLTEEFGGGHWSGLTGERGVLSAMRSSRILVARQGREIVGTLRLATKKPWAIDASYYTKVARPLYLTDMAVEPSKQRMGVGRGLLEEAAEVARAWPADAIRLDSYDAAAGAGPFYEKCGYREVGRASYRGNPLIYYEKLITAGSG